MKLQSEISSVIQLILSYRTHSMVSDLVTTNLMNLSIMAHDAFQSTRQIDVFYGDFKAVFLQFLQLRAKNEIPMCLWQYDTSIYRIQVYRISKSIEKHHIINQSHLPAKHTRQWKSHIIFLHTYRTSFISFFHSTPHIVK